MANEYRKRKLIGIFRRLAKQTTNMQVALDAAVWLIWLEGFAGELQAVRPPTAPTSSKGQPVKGESGVGITIEMLNQILQADPETEPKKS
jgi:hypothetical protein